MDAVLKVLNEDNEEKLEQQEYLTKDDVEIRDISSDEDEEIYKTKQGQYLDEVSTVFRRRMKLIKQTINRVYPELEEERKRDIELMEDAIARFNEENDQIIEYDKILHILKTSNIPFVNIFIKGMFLNIFSELDTFTGNYLYSLFNLKPEVISNNQKQFNASEIFECGSIEDFREKVIEKEIDSIKRESYIDQIEILEKLFSIKTLKDFSNWNKYVEITQRRNIVMHCDSIVTEQYYKICKKNGSNAYNKVGERLELDYEYLKAAFSVIEEVSVKLVQVLWRKCFTEKECQEEFDAVLNEYIFALLIDEEWDVAMELGNFSCNVIKAKTGEYKMMFLVNYCIALNNLDKNEETIKLLEGVDFSAIHREFLLAKYVLINDFDNAIKLMFDIGDKGEYFNKHGYAVFPLFKEIRLNEKFILAYKEIFGEDIYKEEIKLKIKEAEEENIEEENTEEEYTDEEYTDEENLVKEE